jgi:hypothetical protein
VGTETLICGTLGVNVNAIVAVNVCVEVDVKVGVNVGGSGVSVNAGSCEVGGKVADKADSTNPAITVCAAAVLIAPESCSGIAGSAQARTTIDKMVNVRATRLESNMVPPNNLRQSLTTTEDKYAVLLIVRGQFLEQSPDPSRY